jgi:hypothetical protein
MLRSFMVIKGAKSISQLDKQQVALRRLLRYWICTAFRRWTSYGDLRHIARGLECLGKILMRQQSVAFEAVIRVAPECPSYSEAYRHITTYITGLSHLIFIVGGA